MNFSSIHKGRGRYIHLLNAILFSFWIKPIIRRMWYWDRCDHISSISFPVADILTFIFKHSYRLCNNRKTIEKQLEWITVNTSSFLIRWQQLETHFILLLITLYQVWKYVTYTMVSIMIFVHFYIVSPRDMPTHSIQYNIASDERVSNPCT